MQLMGSQLLVKSQPGEGSTFWFDVTLPVVDSPTVEPTSPRLTRNIKGYEGTRRKVLVVDDKLYNRLLLIDMLEPLGFEVSTAVNGQEAVDKAMTWLPDAIVMDLLMPAKTGFEAAREIRQRPEMKDVCIIAASASVLEADQEKSRLAGCDAFLSKPIKTESLLDLLATNLKLTWIYTKPVGEAEAAAPLVPPPQAELMALHQLARSGRISEVQRMTAGLTELDEAYLPFLTQLQELAKFFEIEKIKVFIEQFIKEGENGPD
jgi:CheY-like chemotaxis protein